MSIGLILLSLLCSRVGRNAVKKRLCYFSLAVLSLATLTGCQQIKASSCLARHQAELENAKYYTMDCQQVWQQRAAVTLRRTDYWLRLMTCAGQLNSQQAYHQSRNLPTMDWSYPLMRDILLLQSRSSAVEQQQILAQFVRHQAQSPAILHPLLQLWHDNQVSRIGWQTEHQRTEQLQFSLDNQRESQRRLQSRLDATRQKLEKLTEIERQLSTRKPMSN